MMSKIVSILAMAMLATGSAALAQPTPTEPPAPTTAPSAAKGIAKTADNAEVVVKGKRLRACHEKDQACIQEVVAEAWKQYPEKVDGFCVREEWRVIQQRQTLETIAGGGAFGQSASTDVDDQLPPAERVLCEYGAKLRADKKLAAQHVASPSPGTPPSSPPIAAPTPGPVAGDGAAAHPAAATPPPG